MLNPCFPQFTTSLPWLTQVSVAQVPWQLLLGSRIFHTLHFLCGLVKPWENDSWQWIFALDFLNSSFSELSPVQAILGNFLCCSNVCGPPCRPNPCSCSLPYPKARGPLFCRCQRGLTVLQCTSNRFFSLHYFIRMLSAASKVKHNQKERKQGEKCILSHNKKSRVRTVPK